MYIFFVENTSNTCRKRTFNYLCGETEVVEQTQLTEEEKAQLAESKISIDEEPFWRQFCNVQAIVLLVITTFIFGFYA